MPQPVTEHTRAIIARSLPLVVQHKDAIISGTEAHLSGVDGYKEVFGQSEVVAMILTELLLKQAAAIVEEGGMRDVEAHAREHWSLGIEGRHYSRFGDALVPILRDVLGPQAPREVASAWCDTFWAVVQPVRAVLTP
jgi:hemoglobin-like flavoprotein